MTLVYEPIKFMVNREVINELWLDGAKITRVDRENIWVKQQNLKTIWRESSAQGYKLMESFLGL